MDKILQTVTSFVNISDEAKDAENSDSKAERAKKKDRETNRGKEVGLANVGSFIFMTRVGQALW